MQIHAAWLHANTKLLLKKKKGHGENLQYLPLQDLQEFEIQTVNLTLIRLLKF